ncbi:MAG: efflux RND transporter permease subunit, partial [Chlorobi bacterium]|nr:efflux RND transporter permease subunit [Chlorobiota bacterium]
MLNKIIQYSLHNRLLILVAGVLIMAAGVYVSTNMEVDVFPDLNAPTVVVMTEAHGMAPEEVERMVTFPIETAVNGATGIRRVRSGSSMGFSIVWVEFDWGVDIYNARQTVSEKLANVKEQLPEGAGNPIIAPQSSLLGEIMIFAMTADTTSPMKLRTMADWLVRPALLSVGGVAQVTVIGGEFKEYQILADQQKLKYYKVTNDELIAACKESNNNASGGFFNEHGNKYLVRGIGRTTDPDEIANTVIKITDGFPIKISDVAQVKIAAAPKIGDGSYRGERAVVLSVNKQPNINTIELTDKLKAELADIKKSLPPDVKFHTDVFDQSDFIKTSINNVQTALTEGSIFVIVILFLFLMNYRTTLISLLAIPLSLLVAILTLDFLGFTINTMSLGGMAIAIGSLVDDAIIDVENVYKRLRENVRKPDEEKENTLKVIYEASKEIRASILNATLIIIVAFTPLFFLSGMEGRMLQPLGVAYIVALFASLVVALTITPALCSLMLTNEKQLLKRNKDGWLARILNKAYAAGLVKVMKVKKIVLTIAILMFVGSLLLFFGFGRSFLPPFNEGSLTINTSTMPGISLEESYKLGQQAEEALLTIPEIITVSRKTGRAELAEHSFDVNVSELDAPFALNGRPREDFLREVRSKLNAIPGIIVTVGQPITHRMDHMLSGSKTSIAIKLFGTD